MTMSHCNVRQMVALVKCFRSHLAPAHTLSFTPCRLYSHRKHGAQNLKDENTNIKTCINSRNDVPLALQFMVNNDIEKQNGCSDHNNIVKINSNCESIDQIKLDIENLKALKSQYVAEQNGIADSLKSKKYLKVSSSKITQYPVSSVPCGACGAFLHCNDPSLPGFIPEEKFLGVKNDNLVKLVCQRCNIIASSNKVVPVEVDKQLYQNIIKRIRMEKALVLMIVDVTDMPNSMIHHYMEYIGKHRPVFIIGNKIDLIPKDEKGYLNRILSRLEMESRMAHSCDINIKHICLISAKTGYGVEELINKLINYWNVEGNVYLVGTTNSGKSTLFNRFLESDYCKDICRDIAQRASVSMWPGTTLNLIKFPIIKPRHWKMALRVQRLIKDRLADVITRDTMKGQLRSHGKSANAVLFATVGKTKFQNEEIKKAEEEKYTLSGANFSGYSLNKDGDINESHRLSEQSFWKSRVTLTDEQYPDSKWTYDTPGLVNDNQIINRLTAEELRLMLHRHMIRPRVFVMKPGQVMFITGLARIDYLEGAANTFFTVHTTHFLSVYVVNINDADTFYEENLGTKTLQIPLGDINRLNRFPSLVGREFYIETKEPLIAVADLQLSSLGWVSFAGKDKSIHVRAYTPAGVGMCLRMPALLPNILTFKGERIGNSRQYMIKKLIA